jgi:hypothetical protein
MSDMTTPPSQPAPMKPERHNASRLGPLLGIFVIVAGAAALLFLKNPWMKQAPTPVQTPQSGTPAPTPILPPPPPGEETSTPNGGTPTSTPGYTEEATTTHDLGETVQFFLNNDTIFRDPKNPERRFTVTAIEFLDSRCPTGVTCIWQGELGVRLRVIDQRTGQTMEVYLGLVRARTATVLGLRFLLNDIDEGKGGTYADITVQ